MNPTPSIGRIVLVHEHGGKVRPAIISGVRKDGIHIDCHAFGGAVYSAEAWVQLLKGVPYYAQTPDPPQNCWLWWSWPPRIP